MKETQHQLVHSQLEEPVPSLKRSPKCTEETLWAGKGRQASSSLYSETFLTSKRTRNMAKAALANSLFPSLMLIKGKPAASITKRWRAMMTQSTKLISTTRTPPTSTTKEPATMINWRVHLPLVDSSSQTNKRLILSHRKQRRMPPKNKSNLPLQLAKKKSRIRLRPMSASLSCSLTSMWRTSDYKESSSTTEIQWKAWSKIL